MVHSRGLMPICRWLLAVWAAVSLCAGVASSASEPEEGLGCAPRAVCVAARLLRREVSDAEIRQAFQGRVSGVHSAEDIAQAVERLGLAARTVRLDPKGPGLAPVPLIVAVKESAHSSQPDHFLVLYGEKGASVQVLDFPYSPHFIASTELGRAWDGRGIYIAGAEKDLPSSGDRPLLAAMFAGGAILVAIASVALCFRSRRVAVR